MGKHDLDLEIEKFPEGDDVKYFGVALIDRDRNCRLAEVGPCDFGIVVWNGDWQLRCYMNHRHKVTFLSLTKEKAIELCRNLKTEQLGDGEVSE